MSEPSFQTPKSQSWIHPNYSCNNDDKLNCQTETLTSLYLKCALFNLFHNRMQNSMLYSPQSNSQKLDKWGVVVLKHTQDGCLRSDVFCDQRQLWLQLTHLCCNSKLLEDRQILMYYMLYFSVTAIFYVCLLLHLKASSDKSSICWVDLTNF